MEIQDAKPLNRRGGTYEDHLADYDSTQADIDGLTAVLNGNALIAALFLTCNVPLLSDPEADTYHVWRMRAQLFFSAASVMLHGTCVFVAAESGFVLGNISKIHPSLQAEQLKHFRSTPIGARIEPLSGFTYIWGIVCAMIAWGAHMGECYGTPDGDIVGAVLATFFLCLGFFAWFIVGGYVSRMHRRVNERPSVTDGMGTGQGALASLGQPSRRDNRGRVLRPATTPAHDMFRA